MFGHGANIAAVADRAVVDSPVSPTWMRSPQVSLGQASRSGLPWASARCGSTLRGGRKLKAIHSTRNAHCCRALSSHISFPLTIRVHRGDTEQRTFAPPHGCFDETHRLSVLFCFGGGGAYGEGVEAMVGRRTCIRSSARRVGTGRNDRGNAPPPGDLNHLRVSNDRSSRLIFALTIVLIIFTVEQVIPLIMRATPFVVQAIDAVQKWIR